MKTITVELMQHTPMIHFQVRYDQTQTRREQRGATLRASEVKPKLDRYLMNKLGNKLKREWLVGSGTHDALDYKMKIVADDGDGTASVVQLPRPTSTYNPKNNKTKWKADFPMLLANLMGGGQENIEDLRFLSMHKKVTMYIYLRAREVKDEKTGEKHLDDTWYKGLEEKLRELLPQFFATTNFGQRSNKGFGSFTVKSIDGSLEKDEKFIKMKPFRIYDVWEGELMKWLKYRTEYEKEQRNKVYSFSIQKKLFEEINKLWCDIGDKVKINTAINYNYIDSTESYIKCLKEIYCKKGYINKEFPYLPGPIMFKPISFVDGVSLKYCVNILPDNGMIQRLRMTYKSEEEIDRKNKVTLCPSKIGKMDVIQEIVDKIQ